MISNTDDQCIKQYEELKFHKKHRFIVYKVVQEKVIIQTIGERQKNWESFKAVLPPLEPRMCVFDLEYTSNDGMHCSRLFFCYWLPDNTPLKMKLPYASFKESFKTKIDVGGKQIVLTSADEYKQEEIIKEFDK